MKTRHLLALLSALGAMAVCTTTLAQAGQVAGRPTMDARAIVAEAQAIPPGGIDDLKAVDIGGIKQWIRVRGNDPDNPILLFIHGGPGSPMMPQSWIFQRPLEDFFTVVQWDQRGAGKTFATSDRPPQDPLTLQQMQSDAEQLVDYLRKTYGKKKIFVMGHSFGSIIGMRVALHRPDALYAYIGVGQMVNAVDNETISYQMVKRAAAKAGNAQAEKELASIAPYPGPAGSVPPVEKIAVERKWVVALGGMRYGRSTDPEADFQSISAVYDQHDIVAAGKGEEASVMALVPQLMSVDFTRSTHFDCPVFFFAGADDMATPSSIVETFYGRVEAPKKTLFKIQRAAHDVMFDASGQVLVDLVQAVRPLAAH
jgi:proline iminopeptidase